MSKGDRNRLNAQEQKKYRESVLWDNMKKNKKKKEKKNGN